MLIGMFIISFTSGFEFDNVERYDTDTKTFTINNCNIWIGTCVITGERLVTAQLTTPHNVMVARGNDMLVGEFTFKTSGELLDVFSGLYLKDMKSGNSISRGKQYKYKTFKEVSVDDYETVCEEVETHNGTSFQCQRIEVGNHLETQMEWKPISNPNNVFIPNTVYEIGVFVDVEKDDYGDWVPEFYNYHLVEEWATWTESLNANLIIYYKLDGTPDPVLDSANYLNGTNNGATSGQSGIIGNGYSFDTSSEDSIISGIIPEIVNTNWTISLWVNSTGIGIDQFLAGTRQSSSSNYWFIEILANSSVKVESGDMGLFILGVDSLTSNTWHHIVLQVAANNVSLYIDGVVNGIDTSTTLLTVNSDRTVEIGRWYNGFSTTFNGIIDEVGLWNRSLTKSEVEQLYNNGSGITFTLPPIVTLNSPIDNFNSSSNMIIFNATASSPSSITLVNMSLWTNETGDFEVRNSTIITGTTNTTTWSRNLNDGTYLWNVQGCNDENNCSFASQNRTFNVDLVLPQITVETPTGLLDYNYIGGNETLNVTFIDTKLDTCWYNYNGTNITILGCLTGVKNSTLFILEENNFNMTIYVNDTASNENSTFIEWNYKVLEISQTFNNQTTEGASETFLINFTKVSSLQVSIINLIYNQTIHSAAYSVSGDDIASVISVTIPQITTNTNFTFHWNITLNDGSSIITNSNNQSASTINIDNCSSFSNIIYNFTQRDEEEKTLLGDNNTIELQVNLFDTTKSSLLINFSQTFNSINPVQVCLEKALLTTVNYSSYVIVKYHANTSTNITYSVEYHNILNQTIGNTTVPKNINLFNLKRDDATKFRLTFRDSSYVLAPNILVQVHRQYIEDNDFKIVEIPLTDSNGQTILNLVRNNIIYNFIMVNEAREIVGTFNSQTAFCQDFTIDDCTINLAPDSESASAFDYNEKFDIFITSPTYDNLTELISINFITGDFQSKTVRIDIIRNNEFGNRSVCSNSLTAASGILSCNVSSIVDTDQFLFISIYVDDELAQQNTINLNATTLNFGILNGAFYAFMMILTLLCLFMEDKRVLVLSLAIGWVVIISLGLLAGSFIGPDTAGIWLLISIVIFFWKLNKEDNP